MESVNDILRLTFDHLNKKCSGYILNEDQQKQIAAKEDEANTLALKVLNKEIDIEEFKAFMRNYIKIIEKMCAY